MADASGSTVPRRQLGRHLKELREAAKLTRKGAGDLIEVSDTTMWRIETGKAPIRKHDVEALCRHYDASEETTRALIALASESKAKGWWHSYGDVIPSGFDVYIGLQEAASELWIYQAELVPGLLQIEEYARALVRLHNPDEDEEEIERRVTLRLERQSLLTRVSQPPPRLSVALHEAALHLPIGGASVMARQLAHLVYVAQLPHITIKVVPFEAGLQPGVLTGPFTLLKYPVNEEGKEAEPPTVYSDGFTGSLYLDKPNEIASYERAFAGIWEAAHDDQDSVTLISEIAGRHERRA
ncbi:helix-turn-helix domain-containing protein [Streptomyces albus]|uniref:helix-turn-helix domain-containing protein n=1 Tax=Streptomyces TaxID=1883 RepID=UPI0021619EC3|nr:helix-turn-helix transcriptional regulator [Streptomyces albus]UVN55756.1 helix-turn-helix domain-containing protein [Streptomyces albus]GHJ21554.1 transcriptional regulator [Streptomyces albus]GHJ23229.1 transcriptional regulator [Streptomyces albus]